MRICVLGAGSWGTTLAILLANKSHEVSLWSFRESDAELIRTTQENAAFLPGIHVPETVDVSSKLQAAVEGAEILVGAVPSQYLRNVVEQLKGLPLDRTLVVNVAKGIENGTLMTMSEVSRSIPTTVVAASTDPETARTVQKVFMAPYFRVYESQDLRGVELGGALKNVIAIAAGIVEGASLGDNTKAALMTRGIAEITRLGVAMGAQVRTFGGLSGIGDLMVTCMSRHSRNRHIGVEIGKGRKLPEILSEMVMVAEGIATTESASELARRVQVEVPIINEVHRILFEGKDPLAACYDLMTRDPKGEL
jgi:glycerol-3-phosphate dehydrogenase (NAD(P)+)